MLIIFASYWDLNPCYLLYVKLLFVSFKVLLSQTGTQKFSFYYCLLVLNGFKLISRKILRYGKCLYGKYHIYGEFLMLLIYFLGLLVLSLVEKCF